LEHVQQSLPGPKSELPLTSQSIHQFHLPHTYSQNGFAQIINIHCVTLFYNSTTIQNPSNNAPANPLILISTAQNKRDTTPCQHPLSTQAISLKHLAAINPKQAVANKQLEPHLPKQLPLVQKMPPLR